MGKQLNQQNISIARRKFVPLPVSPRLVPPKRDLQKIRTSFNGSDITHKKVTQTYQ